MKKWLPVLVFVLGLGSCFSFPQTQQDNPKDPFDRYLTSVKTHQPEAALVRFADGCGFEISHLRPRFAVGPGSSFTRVEDLGKGLASVETDFYSTAEVRVNADHVFLEVWANSDDVGSEVRYLECFIGGKLSQAEVVDWNVPVEKGDPETWGYARRWERAPDGRLKPTKAEFVDAFGHSSPKPKLDSEGEKSLLWIPFLGSLDEWKLPPSMLR